MRVRTPRMCTGRFACEEGALSDHAFSDRLLRALRRLCVLRALSAPHGGASASERNARKAAKHASTYAPPAYGQESHVTKAPSLTTHSLIACCVRCIECTSARRPRVLQVCVKAISGGM